MGFGEIVGNESPLRHTSSVTTPCAYSLERTLAAKPDRQSPSPAVAPWQHSRREIGRAAANDSRTVGGSARHAGLPQMTVERMSIALSLELSGGGASREETFSHLRLDACHPQAKVHELFHARFDPLGGCETGPLRGVGDNTSRSAWQVDDCAVPVFTWILRFLVDLAVLANSIGP